ncbi:MAG: hypothetical protein AAF911_12770 [Planctomycetota bacterium]
MRDDQVELVEEAKQFLDELFGAGIPIQNILRTGSVPEGWLDRYLKFVERVESAWDVESPLPREIVAVIYNASVYGTKRYLDGQRINLGKTTKDTSDEINRIRWAGDRLLLLPFGSAGN